MTAVGLGHDEVWALLPWSANGTLEGAEEAAVASHLLTCAACREEI
jgi:hypothetical protein